MHRASYLISVSEWAVEGRALLGQGLPQENARYQPIPPGEASFGERASAALSEFLTQAAWQPAPLVMVLPSAEITCRRLNFPFKNAKQIQKALLFELEEELLDPVETFIETIEVFPPNEALTPVQVYLARKDMMETLLAVCQQHGLPVIKATFSASALLTLNPAVEGLHYQIYLGPEEGYVAQVVGGRLNEVEILDDYIPVKLLLEMGAGSARSPEAFLGALRKGAGSANGEEFGEQNPPPATLPIALQPVVNEINRYLRIHSAGNVFTLSLHGLMSRLVDWDEAQGELTLQKTTAALPLPGERDLPGILGELANPSRALLSSRGLNFSSTQGALLAQIKELRWPLMVAGILSFICLTLVGVNTLVKTNRLQKHLNELNAQVKTVLNVPLPENTPMVNAALAKLTDESNKLQKDLLVNERFAAYDFEVLRLFQDISGISTNHPQVT
ncbi:MAG: type II secretion system protein GspL, partial [Deltaproteobacteria bacterium]|nr:type II secretion system protein GspL [Deltaproteobacteria bacterium]